MSLYIHDFFKFYSAKDLVEEYLNYPADGYVLSFQGPLASPRYHNGISFTEIAAEDALGASEDYDFDYAVWSYGKMIAPHSETSGEVDPSRGNRIISTPLLIERVGLASVLKFQFAHNRAQPIEFQSYNTGTHNLTLRFKDIQYGGDITAWKNQQLVVARDMPLDDADVLTGRGGLEIDIKSEVEEWVGDVVSFDGRTMVLNIPSPPSPTSKLSDVSIIGPNNQTMFVLPLGHVLDTGIEEYAANAASLGLDDWTYYDADAYSTAKYKIITPKIETTQDEVGERDKYILILERNKTFTNFGNGHQLLVDIFV